MSSTDSDAPTASVVLDPTLRQDNDDVSICYSEASHKEASILTKINSLGLSTPINVQPDNVSGKPETQATINTKQEAEKGDHHIHSSKVMHVYAGASLESLSLLNVNDDASPFYFDGLLFHGRLVVRIRHFKGARPQSSTIGTIATNDSSETSNLTAEDYFGDKKRIFSIQFEGVFKEVNLCYPPPYSK